MTGRSVNALADKLRDDLDEANAAREVAETRAERKVLNKRIHMLKGLIQCETRRGYVELKEAARAGGVGGAALVWTFVGLPIPCQRRRPSTMMGGASRSAAG